MAFPFPLEENFKVRQEAILVKDAKVHNLKGISLRIPLREFVAIAGVSGSGKSSLALGVLFHEGSRRYLESLSTYTRRRIEEDTTRAEATVEHVPAAIALRQRPSVPGIRSTFGTLTELNNVLRLMYSRLGSHLCPNGHRVPPSPTMALTGELTCPECGEVFMGPDAESFAFNSGGACPQCGGTGLALLVDEKSLVPDEGLTIEQGAVAPWNSLMWSLMVDVCRAMGVRTDIPYRDLSAKEKEIVLHGPMEKKHILYRSKKGDDFAELDFTYYSALKTVENALSKAKDEKGMKRVAKFLIESECPACHGSRLSEKARSSLLAGLPLERAAALPLADLVAFLKEIPAKVPPSMKEMALEMLRQFMMMATPLLNLGLDYLSLERAGNSLSTGERQRIALARAVRSETTGVLYVLDEPSIGLHPANVDGLLALFRELVEQGNSLIVVDHDEKILASSSYLVELGPGAGKDGGTIISQGPTAEATASPASLIGPYLSGSKKVLIRKRATGEEMWDGGRLSLSSKAIHTVKPLHVSFPKGRLSVVTGVSGSGKTTMVLESLIPGLKAQIGGLPLPSHVTNIESAGIKKLALVDATPIGANVRSTLATYSGILDELRMAYAKLPIAKAHGYTASSFSYNTGNLRCPTCDGTGSITMDVQFLPDVELPCPDCHGRRYRKGIDGIRFPDGNGLPLPEMLSLTVEEAYSRCAPLLRAKARLKTLIDLGLGYLTLGEATPSLSGGEAQRLKLAFEMGMNQDSSLFVFDEPTIGLHPLDVEKLLEVFDALLSKGATIIVIEHDLDFISNADYIVDMGPGGGHKGGNVVYQGPLDGILDVKESVTGPYLRKYLSD